MLAAVLGQLAADQIQGLHAIRAFVDHGDAGVADELRHAPFLDIAVAAENLLGQHRRLEPLVGQKALDDRGHQRHQPLGIGIAVMALVDHMRAPQHQHPGALQKRFLVHQAAADVGMHDQRIGRPLGVGGARDGPALQAVLGIGDGVLIGRDRAGIALQSHAQARLVHHGEHGPHPLVQVAQQPAAGIVIVHDAGGVAVDAHLVFQRAHRHAVAFPQAAIRVHQKLGHDEQADPPGSLAAARCLGQHQMDDVFRQVVIAGRDEDLLPRDQIAAVVLGFGPGAQDAQIGAAMRFGQVHRAGPVATDHPGQIGLLLRLGAVGVDRRIGAVGQALIHVEGHVGRHEQLSRGHAHHIGHALPAIVGVAIERRPAALLHRREGAVESLGRAHHAVFQAAALSVAHGVQRRQNLGRQLAGGFQDRLGEAWFQILVARQAGLRKLQHVMQRELHVADGRNVDRHGIDPVLLASDWAARRCSASES